MMKKIFILGLLFILSFLSVARASKEQVFSYGCPVPQKQQYDYNRRMSGDKICDQNLKGTIFPFSEEQQREHNVSVSKNKIQDLNIQDILQYPDLRSLDVSGRELFDSTNYKLLDFFRSIESGLSFLTELNLSDNGVKDSDFIDIKNSPLSTRLQVLSIGKTFGEGEITQEGARLLSICFPNLLKLSLANQKIENEGITHILQFKNIYALNLSGAGLSSLEGFQNMSKLKYLNISKTEGLDYTPIKSLKYLKKLDLSQNWINDSSVYCLSESCFASTLISLKIGNLSFKTHDQNNSATIGLMGCELIVKNFHNLRTLSIGYQNLGNEGAKIILGLTSLEKLYLDYNRITDKGLENIGNLKNLKRLGLFYNPVFIDFAIKFLETSFNNNPRVDLWGTRLGGTVLGGNHDKTSLKKIVEHDIEYSIAKNNKKVKDLNNKTIELNKKLKELKQQNNN